MKAAYVKPATTIDQQADQLIERGLIVHDRERLLRELRTIGYYRLSAYWLPFELPAPKNRARSKQFQDGTRHEDIVELYIFDRKLRLLVMEAVERIEIAVRASWTNRLALAAGPHAHLDPTNFTNPWEHVGKVAQLARYISQSNEVFLEHYKNTYDVPYMPPLWASTESMTIGELSQWVAMTKDRSVRRHVADDLGLRTSEVVDSVLQVLAYVRNMCAHHGRLWNRRFVKKFMLIKRLRSELIILGTGEVDNRIYNVLVVCLHMLRVQSPQTSFADRITALMETISEGQRDAMGFPRDWRERVTWSLSAT
jgi:abortive infection bacteriophage resistance protein